MPSIPQISLALLASWITWKVFKRLTDQDPLANIPGPPSDSLITGSLMRMIDNNAWEYLKQITDQYGSAFRFSGLLNRNGLFIHDPKALYHITTKDQNVYEEPLDFIQNNAKVFGKGMLSTYGDHHRKQRKLLNPVFAVPHMREMTPIFFGVLAKLKETLTREVLHGEKEVDILSWTTRTALELVGQSGFGYSFDSLQEVTSEHPFATCMKNYFRTVNSPGIQFGRKFIFPYVYNLGSSKFQRAVVDFVPWKALHELRDQSDIMHKTATDILEATKLSLEGDTEALSTRIGGGKDIMSILVKANMAAAEEDRLPEDELLAQISTMTFAAMDTTSNAISRILYLLAERPEIQEKLRHELVEAFAENSQPDYDILTTLPYLDAVCKESLRLYAPVPMLQRVVMKDYVLPLGKPITTLDGKSLDEIFVPKDTRILISLIHCNRDPEIWGPDAMEWKPERWLTPLPDSVIESRIPGVYSHLMTFLGGARACIGFKFAQLEMKVALSILVQSFKFSPSDKKIEWQLNGVTQPTIEGAELTPTGHKKLQLPIMMSLV